MKFGEAIEELKEGNRVARMGWNGKRMWLKYVDSYEIHDHDFDNIGLSPWIGMKTADNKFVPWIASETDMLAEDWGFVVNPEKVCCLCKEEAGTLMLDDNNCICENCAQIQSELAP